VRPTTSVLSAEGKLKPALRHAEALTVQPIFVLVMIATFHARLPDPSSQLGDTLIEVIVSALILGVIVVGTLTGLNSANRFTSLDRERSQADLLAQQEEDQLRSEPIQKISQLSETKDVVQHEVDASGTRYVLSSTAELVTASGTASCSASSPEADYIETATKVTWSSLGTGKPVVETSIISPPPGSAIIAQVTGPAGEPLPKMDVATKGPSDLSAETTSDGCASLAVAPGEYTVNVSKPGYIDNRDYENSDEDPATNASFFVVAENTVKKSYEFGLAGELKVSFENPSTKAAVTGESFVAFNVQAPSPSFKSFGELGKPEALVTAKKLFPFSGAEYSVYAGSCPADSPAANGQGAPPTRLVPAGGSAEATVAEPAINLLVTNGTSASHGSPIEASGTLIDTGCEKEGVTAKRTFKTLASTGKLADPNFPYGTYSLCVTATISGKPRKLTKVVENNLPAGETVEMYLGEGEEKSGCP